MTYVAPPYTNAHSTFHEDDIAVPAPHTFYSSRPSMNGFSHPALGNNGAEPAYTPPPHNELEEGFLRITVTHLDRNRKDPLYKFDVTVRALFFHHLNHTCSMTRLPSSYSPPHSALFLSSSSPASFSPLLLLDQPPALQAQDLQVHRAHLRRI